MGELETTAAAGPVPLISRGAAELGQQHVPQGMKSAPLHPRGRSFTFGTKCLGKKKKKRREISLATHQEEAASASAARDGICQHGPCPGDWEIPEGTCSLENEKLMEVGNKGEQNACAEVAGLLLSMWHIQQTGNLSP